MRDSKEITKLLAEVSEKEAGELESQDLDFKEWNTRSMKDAVALVVKMAICMANGGGGTVVFGVNDKLRGRAKAVRGVAPEVDVNRLKKAVYDSTDPKLMPVFEDLQVPEGTGRLLIMQVYPGLPPYTDTAGHGTIRVGKDCKPLTGTLRRRLMVESGEADFTAEEVRGNAAEMISPAALEELRESARKEQAPKELLRLNDQDLLAALGVLRDQRLTYAGLVLAGKESAIQERLPGYVWTYLRMKSDTSYTDRIDGHSALPVALAKILDRIMADNPITTVEQGLFHFEYRTYPEVALRETLMNAFCHAEYHPASIILVKHFPTRLEIANPGGLVGGITPENILHHRPVSRNPLLIEALSKLRLVNRSNLGVTRMFTSMLIEGKEPPIIEDKGESVTVTFLFKDISVPFRMFIAEEYKRDRSLGVDHLLILQYLLRHSEIDTSSAAGICQRNTDETREILSTMERDFEYLERGGPTGKGTYWTLRPDLHRRLSPPGHPERDRRIDWEAAKTRVLSVLKHRSQSQEPGISNSDIRRLTHFNRNQVFRMMRELMAEEKRIVLRGERKAARYEWNIEK
jgi:ATP-dependent DNA helicase RecG